MEVTPHLKSVLKNYQHSATKSLQGPGLSLVAVKTETPSPEIKEEEFVAAPFPVQQVPILTIPDTCSERTETILEGESISCFVVGGEKRLCLPQVLNSVLREFSLQQINQECDHLQIYCSRCTPEQLNVLKNQGILPSGAPSCGLITKTDAERLCSALLFKQVREQAASSTGLRPRKGALSIPIYHECFGRASGLCFPELYVNKNAKCIECGDCQVGFSPQQFVCHVHDELENRTVHWGFDSGNWRSYLYVPIDHGERERFVKILDEMKEMYDGNLVFPPPIVEPVIKRKQVPSVAEIIKDHELPLKKQKLSEYHNALAHIPYNVQHLQQIYASLDQVYIHQYLQECSPNRHLSAFKPVVQSIKESKIRHATAMGRYPADPPVLQHPERVVPSSESERFERTYQPNVALAPPPALPKKHRYGKEFAEVKTEPVEDEAKPVVSVVRKYNPEIELSTDTEDSASETEKCDINKLEELLRDVDKSKKDKVVEYLRSVCKENERLSKNARVTDERLKELEYRNVELLKELNALKLKHHHHNHRAVENGVGSPNGDDATGLNGSSNTHEDEKTSKECQKSVIAIVGEQKDVKLKTAPE